MLKYYSWYYYLFEDKIHTEDLITFPSKKYVAVENVEVYFRTPEIVKLRVWTIPQIYIERFGLLWKLRKIHSFHFWILDFLCFWVHFWHFYGLFHGIFFIIIEEKYMFYLWTVCENVTVNLFIYENVNSGVKFKMIWLCDSRKIQNDF